MPKKKKTIEEHLQAVQYLLAGILLKRNPNVKEVAKVIGCSDNLLTKMYPERTSKNEK